jgi:hypothetical protein
MTKTFFLNAPSSHTKIFPLASDREYFSKPVRVIPQYSLIDGHLLVVTDPERGHTYPVNPAHVKRG